MKEEFVIRKVEISSPDYGEYPGRRSVKDLLKNGFLLLDKPRGPTSHDVTAHVKRILGVKKAGHAGTLDPNASGLLPIMLQNACKVIPALQKLDKEYVGVMHLHKNVKNKELENVLKNFVGIIKQVPPVKSAVKRRERERKIHKIEILDRKNKDICFYIKCEAGTYIRKIVDDIGKKIGGAHLKELRRIKVGQFEEKKAWTIQEVKNAYESWKENHDELIREIILPVEEAVKHLKKVFIKDSAVDAICNGAPLATTGISIMSKDIEKNDLVAIMSLKGELVALGIAKMTTEDMKRKGIAVKTDRVIMNRGTYPKWKKKIS